MAILDTEMGITRVTFDYDGVFVPGPPSGGTLLKLAKGAVTGGFRPGFYPEVITYLAPKTFLAKAWDAYQYRSHRNRKIRPESVQAIHRLKALGEELGLPIEVGILTGRDPSKHDLVKKDLEEAGLAPYLFLLPNPGYRSPLWKEMNARGKQHFHFEDDLDPALRMSGLGTQVYLLRNLSNRDKLLRVNGIKLGPNIIPINNITEGVNDLEQRLKRAV